MGVVTLLTVSTAILQFLAGIVVARSLGPEGRGLLTVVVSIAGIGSIASALGTGVSYRRLFPKGESNVRDFLQATSILTVFLGIPITCLTIFGVGRLVDDAVFTPTVSALFLLFGITNILWLQGKEGLAANGQIQFGAIVGTWGSVIFLVACTALVLAGHGSVSGILGAYVLMNLVQTILVWRRLLDRTKRTASLGTRALIRSGPPYLAYFLGQESVFRLDRTLIGIFSTSSSVGLFAVGAGLAEILRLPVLASSQYVLHDTANGRLRIRGVIRRTGLWVILVLGAGAVLWPIAPILIPLLYGQEFAWAVGPFRVLLAAQVCLVPFLIVSRALVGMGTRWSASLPSIVGLIMLFVAAPILISEYGALGGAFTCMLSYTAMSVTSLLALRRLGKATPSPKPIG